MKSTEKVDVIKNTVTATCETEQKNASKFINTFTPIINWVVPPQSSQLFKNVGLDLSTNKRNKEGTKEMNVSKETTNMPKPYITINGQEGKFVLNKQYQNHNPNCKNPCGICAHIKWKEAMNTSEGKTTTKGSKKGRRKWYGTT